jgi:membrane protease YdiL (CAAX protease family)
VGGAAGIVLLLGRPLVVDDNSAYLWLFACYLAVGVIGLLPSSPREERRLHPAIVLLVGVSAVVLAAWTTRGVAAIVVTQLGVALVILAAVSEELFFRRLLYGLVLRYIGAPAAIVASAVVFALVHLPLYGTQVFLLNLAAGMLFSWQRWAAGSWVPSAATHAVANVLAVAA